MENKSEDDLPSLEERETYKRRLMVPWEHINNVRQAAEKLSLRLVDVGEFQLARKLLQRANCHDTSKFYGIQFKFLTGETDKEKIKLAIYEHQQENDHHPQYFTDGIKAMNSEQIAEMVCDWWARSSEKGTSLRDFIKDDAMKRFNFTPHSNVYKKIKKFVDLLLDPPFTKL